ncbi:hypothetical protein ACIHCX_16475 [Streptomyces sp. NPDC052043]|uniref:hypothetical protein n=1 Tax=Streptomyces sp. NPDC052043 TaxID=3365684 RepID=UPI0037D7A51F
MATDKMFSTVSSPDVQPRQATESACVHTGRRMTGGAGTVVVLSASEALHGAAGLLGGDHVRFVHELVTSEDTALRILGCLTRHGERRVRVLTPTDAVREDLAARLPRLRLQVRPFAVADPSCRLTDTDRGRAGRPSHPIRQAFVCVIGGWWPYKDPDVVDAALARLNVPVHVLVVGGPAAHGLLTTWAARGLILVGSRIQLSPVLVLGWGCVTPRGRKGLLPRETPRRRERCCLGSRARIACRSPAG